MGSDMYFEEVSEDFVVFYVLQYKHAIQEIKMRVGIFDDDRLWCDRAVEIITDYGNSCDMETEVFCFLSERDMNEYSGEPMDVLFVDIELEQTDGECVKNGIDLALKVNEKWKNCQVVYLTNYLCYATDVYHTEHVFFVLKEQFQSRIREVFEKVIHNLEQKTTRLFFEQIGGASVILAPEEILYFERDGRITHIVTKQGVYSIRDKLGDVMKRLSPVDFVRCHNSYIVYFPAVREMEKGQFVLNDGSRIMISRSHAKAVRNAFMKWALTQMS